MTMIFGIFLLLSILGSILTAQITLITPPLFQPLKTFNTAISVSPVRKDTDLAVIFGSRNAGFKLSTTQKTTLSHLIPFTNTNPIPPSSSNGVSASTLKFLARQDGQCVSKEVDVLQTPYTAHIFIQLDRPTYMPGQEVKYRVIAFDGETKPIELSAIQVKIFNSLGQLVNEQTEFETENEEMEKSYGLYENVYKLDEGTFEGDWKISATIDGDDALLAEKVFTVRRKAVPLYEFKVDIPEVIVLSDRQFYVDISAKYRFNTNVQGTVNLSFINNFTGANMFSAQFRLYSSINRMIRFAEDLKINYILVDYFELGINITFTSNVDGSVQSVVKNVKVYSERIPSISIFTPYAYQPGFSYQIFARVSDSTGLPVTTSSIYAKMYATYYNSKNLAVHKESISKMLTDSVAEFTLPTTSDVTKIVYEVSYLQAKISQTVTVQSSASKPSLRVFVENEPIIGEEASIRVEAPRVISGVTVIVSGGSGLVYRQHFDRLNRYTVTLLIRTIKAMLPQAKVIVYAVDGTNVYYGSAVLTFKRFGDNFLDIIVPNSQNSVNYELNKYVTTIYYDTKPESLVSLLAIDKSQIFEKTGHDIEFSDVLNSLTNKEYLFDAAATYNTNKDVFYDSDNHNFLLNLDFAKKRACTAEETEMLNRIQDSSSVVHTNEGVNFYNTKAALPKEFIIGHPAASKLRNIFLDTWIWETHLAANERNWIQRQIPDSMTTWLFTGFSMHKDYGFALAAPQQLVIGKKFFVELNLPYSIRIGEVLTLDIFTFNFLNQNVNVNLKVYALDEAGVQQFDFVTANGCIFTKQPGNVLESQVTAVIGTGTVQKVYIQGIKAGVITIRVSATTTTFTGQTYEDYIAKTIVVENEGIANYLSNVALLRPSLNSVDVRSLNFTAMGVDPTSIGMKAIVSGNIMGGALSNGQIAYVYASNCGEQKLSKAIRNVFIYKYLKKIGGPEAVLTQTRSTVRSNYDLVLAHKNPADKGYKYYNPSTYYNSSTWITAYSARLFGEMMRIGITPVDKKIVEEALDFCAERQQPDGNFAMVDYTYNPLSESNLSRNAHYTCFVLLAFVTNHGFVDKDYTSTINKAFNSFKYASYLENYAASICAYAASYHDPTIAKKLLDKLDEKNSTTDGVDKYWDNVKGYNSGSCVRMQISSYVALAHLKIGQPDKARPIINWLMKQRQANGEFCATFTSSVGFEAFSEYAIYFGTENTDMEVKIETEAKKPVITRVNNNNAKNVQIFDLPDNNNIAFVTGKGFGFAHVQLSYTYTVLIEKISKYFGLSVSTNITSDISTVRVCSRRLSYGTSNMIILEYKLPSGFVYLAEKTNPMGHSTLVENVEIKHGGTTVFIYYSDLPAYYDSCLYLYTQKIHQVDKLKKGSVKLYVYDNLETIATRFFSLEEGKCNK